VGEAVSAAVLLRWTALSAVIAALLLVVFVLPAEYGIDPTGVGTPLGLTRMGEIKVQLAREAALADSLEAAGLADPAALATPTPTIEAAPEGSDADARPATNRHTLEFLLAPDQGREFKLVMSEGAVVDFAWESDRGGVNYDLHGDGRGEDAGQRTSYARGTGLPSDRGQLVAAFDGTHGWFYRNRTGETVTVTLRVDGAFDEVIEIR